MARREPLPPADVIFGHGRVAEPAPATPKNVKVTVYMPVDVVADIDEFRAVVRRSGTPVDRSRLVREAVILAIGGHGDELVERLNEED